MPQFKKNQNSKPNLPHVLFTEAQHVAGRGAPHVVRPLGALAAREIREDAVLAENSALWNLVQGSRTVGVHDRQLAAQQDEDVAALLACGVCKTKQEQSKTNECTCLLSNKPVP